MKQRQNVTEWLAWLTRARFHLITFLLGIILVIHEITGFTVPLRALLPSILLWYMLAMVYVILLRWIPNARWHAPLQMSCDLLLITGLVYSTGAHESYFISLYLLAVLVGLSLIHI